MSYRTSKLTISLPQDLLSVTDEIAREKKLTRSKLVAMCLKSMAEEHLRTEMANGYKAIAEEQRRVVLLASKRQSEIIPEWK